ncbi:SpvB/TcaC N-terminal domain-containing protein [Dyadobacter fermentans]|uniref:SpvB/TcaC N-terminal domain-containing protein n=1 Tax=Dyadobacter fermentans TaxID=94254 RepID=UPI001CBA8481|nr:SpvB/TcaC N-terminal domain-containing protein [Dyadobacter fermentans]MBZ1362750.1 hypothetical protein [Dyadobacter fermentans]
MELRYTQIALRKGSRRRVMGTLLLFAIPMVIVLLTGRRNNRHQLLLPNETERASRVNGSSGSYKSNFPILSNSDSIGEAENQKPFLELVSDNFPKRQVDPESNTGQMEYHIIENHDETHLIGVGMVNVTDNENGYRITFFSQEGSKNIGISFDPLKIPQGYSIHDVYTYRFNEASNNWEQLKRDGIDFDENKVHSTSSKDGEFINAIIKVPEAPETQGYAPTTLSDIKVGDPASMVQLIQPPVANNQGTANLSYHIETLPGRGGIQPDLNIMYNSDGGNGWMGEGWSLSGISSITVDTRWGVPKYNTLTETETYLLDGQMLAYDENGKTPHRAIDLQRSSITHNGKTVFVERRQNSFHRIERYGTKPENYHWEITDKSGTKYYYGWDVTHNENALIRKKDGMMGIAEWKLTKVVDVWGNYLVLNYMPDYPHPKKIEYTLHDGNQTTFHRVVFKYDDQDRPDDTMISARYGVAINPNAKRLSEILVERDLTKLGSSTPQLVRKYSLKYKSGAFGKTILSAIDQHGDDGKIFNTHKFKYHNEDNSYPFFSKASSIKVNSKALSGSIPINPLGIVNNTTTAIGASTSEGTSFSGYIGVGVGNPTSVDFSAGIQYNNSSSSSEGVNTLIDIDGDGRPDKVFVKGSVLQYEKNLSLGDKIEFDSTPVTISGVNTFMEESSRTTGWGAKVNWGIATLGYDKSSTETIVKTYFSDVNGDGLMDIVKGGHVFFNTGKVKLMNSKQVLEFTKFSSNSPALINGTEVSSSPFSYDNSKESEELINNNPLQEVVKVWEAPFNGQVDVIAPIKLLAGNPEKKPDGVWASIEHRSKEVTLEIKPGDLSQKALSISNLIVTKGDKIFFRLQSGKKLDANGFCDRVKWDPKIDYKSLETMGSAFPIENSVRSRYSFQSSSDFLVSNSLPISLPSNVDKIFVKGKFSKGETMDALTIQVIQLGLDLEKPVIDLRGNHVKDEKGNLLYAYSFDKVLFEKEYGPQETSNTSPVTPILEIDAKDRKLQFIVKSNVNIDLHKVSWEPEIHYSKSLNLASFDSDNNSKPGKDTSVVEKQYPVPNFVFNDTLRFANAKYNIKEEDTGIDFYPSLTISDSIDASFWFAVKSPQKVLAKKLLTYKKGRLTENNPLSVSIGKKIPYIVTFEAAETKLGKQKDIAYQRAVNNIAASNYRLQGNAVNGWFGKTPSAKPHSNGNFIVVSVNGNYKIIPELSVANDLTSGKIVVQAWINGKPIKLEQQDSIINYSKGVFISPLNPISLSNLQANDTVSIQYIYADDILNLNPTLIHQFRLVQFFPAEFWTNRTNQTFGAMYQGWGQFVYNGMDNRYSEKINEQLLYLPKGNSITENDANGFTSKLNEAITKRKPMEKDANYNLLSVAKGVFSPMLPYSNGEVSFWLGGEDSIYLKHDEMSTSRLGIDDVQSINPFESTKQDPSEPDKSYGRGILKISKATSDTYNGGGEFSPTGNLSGFYSTGSAHQVSDFLDMNGDKFPDIVGGDHIQLTNSRGRLTSQLATSGTKHFSENTSGGLSVTGSSKRSQPEKGKVPSPLKMSSTSLVDAKGSEAVGESASSYTGASGAFNISEDNVKTTWVDINGDGLPDRVSTDKYDLNLGYGQYLPIKLDIGDINKAENLSLSPGITTGYSFDKHSFSGGAGLAMSASKSKRSIQDMNGDGLPDKVFIGSNGELKVAVNTGKAFLNYTEWEILAKGGGSYETLGDVASFPIRFLSGGLPDSKRLPWLSLEKTKFNSSNGVSIGGSYTYGFAIPIPPIKFVFNVGFNHSNSIGRTIRQVVDINADGYPDILYSTDEKKMEVWLSKLGQTNKISTIINPLGGVINISYTHTDVSEEHPGGKWIMSEVSLHDGIESDRVDRDAKFDSKRIFSYSGGKYDRYEREFLGFSKIISTDIDFDKNIEKPYRDIVRHYNTDSYFGAGQLMQELVRDAQDTSKKYTITLNRYYDKVVKSVEENNNRVGKFKRQVGVVFPMLMHTINGTFEGEHNVLWQNKSSYFYDESENLKFGYISKFIYKENPENEDDLTISYVTKITYEKNDQINYLIGRPNNVITQNADGSRVYKHDGATYYKWGIENENCRNGKIKEILNYLNKDTILVTLLDYDVRYGSVISKVLPNKLKLTYTYDSGGEPGAPVSEGSNTFSYVTKVTIPERNLWSETFYDYRYGIPIRTRDVNENWMNFKLDRFGRVVQIVGPKECGNPGRNGECQSGKYTVRVQYSLNGTLPDNKNPLARAQQYNEDSNGKQTSPLETINFIDGFNRSVQVKKTAEIVNADGKENDAKWTVTGRVNYDALGRVLESHYPALDNSNGFEFIETPGDNYATKFTYDIIDRNTSTVLPKISNPQGELFDSKIYSKDMNGTVVTTLSANDGSGGLQKREQHFNGSGFLSKEVLYDNSGNANATQFLYDPIHQLKRVIDAGGRITLNNYDQQGNKTVIQHPDAGTTRFKYDEAGRIYSKTTGNGDKIEYKYDHDRLVQIKYPLHKENDVLYVYSNDPNKPKNSANKVIYQEDASGAQSFEYGELGEITTNTRTVIVPFSSKRYTFITKFKYDTWNRLLSITYPDQETVVYNYNKAGLLSSVTGFKDRNLDNTVKKRFDYISKITYDRFDQRVQVISNDDKKVTTTFDYEADRRRLALMKIGGISNNSEYFNSFESSYVYDNQNNVRRNTLSKKKGTATSSMVHTYGYDKLNRLDSAGGVWKNATELATYNLGLSYDGMFNLTSRNLTLEATKTGSPQPTIPHIQYVNNYSYGDGGSHQLTQMKEEIFKKSTPNYNESNTEKYFYDKNGNNTLKSTADKSGNDNVYERKIDWDEENRINAVSVNGYVSQYVYDANGERTIKLSTVEDAVFVNGKFAGDTSSIVSFSLYASPYFSMRNGNGVYTKHIYIGSQRIVSQIENVKAFKDDKNIPLETDAVTCPFPNRPSCNESRTLEAQRVSLNNRMNAVFGRFDFHHETIKPNAFDLPPAFFYNNGINPLTLIPGGKSDSKPSELKPDWLNFYYHTNQVGSTSFITDNDAKVVQYVEYLPYGETFMEQRVNHSSQFLFNGKEQDQETGLYYYGARYYDPHTYQWLGVDPMAEKYPGFSPYNFVLGNPLRNIDLKGEEAEENTNLHVNQSVNSAGYNGVNNIGKYIGQQMGDAGSVRESYISAVSTLDEKNSLERAILKGEMRDKTPNLIRTLLERKRPDLGPPPGSGGRANVTNATANNIGTAFKIGGRALVGASYAYDAYNIFQAPDKYRALMESSVGTLGALGGGTIGTLLGIPSGPGAIGTAVVGSSVGGYYGRKLGGAFYDSIHK